ncbi:hypothetical protein DFH28DRAFT_936033 [Melampsora americana]|nr:hypothetical protein DFH28DRAFT_936033 [Melampsora americana]
MHTNSMQPSLGRVETTILIAFAQFFFLVPKWADLPRKFAVSNIVTQQFSLWLSFTRHKLELFVSKLRPNAISKDQQLYGVHMVELPSATKVEHGARADGQGESKYTGLASK